VLEGTDLFEPNCCVLIPDHVTDDEHPLNSYNVAYPYCRTGIRVRLDEMDANPLLAEVTAFSRFLTIRIVPMLCDANSMLTACVVVDVRPAALGPCAAVGIAHASSHNGFLFVDSSKLKLPAQIAVGLIGTGGEKRTGWINVLPIGW
jgi:hypothetical protein